MVKTNVVVVFIHLALRAVKAVVSVNSGGWVMLGAIDVKRGCILFGFRLLA